MAGSILNPGALQPNQGGLFGSYSPQAGGIFSALKDAAAYLGGGGSTDNFSKYNLTQQDNQVRQKLLAGLTSDDPATRSQAYSTAALLGIDTKPIQQQMASQALPKLLQSMQPSTQTVASTSAPLPNLPGQSVQGGGFSFQAPGMGLSDALAQSGSPELQSEYAPQIIKSQIDQQEKLNSPYDLAPGVRRMVGDQEIASAPLKPTPNQPFNPDGTPNLAFQKYTKDLKTAEQGPAWANVDIAKQKLAMTQQGLIDPDTITFMANQVLAGDKSPFQNLGRGQQGSQNIARLRNEVMNQAKARGLGGSDLASLNAEFSGLQAGERTLGTRTANVEMAATEAQKLMPIAVEASRAVPRTQYPTLNRVIMAAEQGTGDENVVKLGVAVNGLVNTYARAISPTGNPTVSDKDHAREILDKAWSGGQFEAAVGQMQKEIAAARQSPGAVRGEFRGAISGRTPGMAAVPDAPNTPVARTGLPVSQAQLPQKAPAVKIRVFNPATGKLE